MLGPAALIQAYPDSVQAIHGNVLILRDGTRIAISDGREKSPAQRLSQADIADMFREPYPAGPLTAAPQADPGRSRNQALFTALYGDCTRNQVAPRLRRVTWVDGTTILFTAAHGAADHLEAVVRDLHRLGPALTRYLVPNAGTYACRRVAGEPQVSMHAYGAAIDIATRHSDYWRWSGGEAAPYRNHIPAEIVAIFEAHGFIWGGKWRHFDTMHFEYRPELLP